MHYTEKSGSGSGCSEAKGCVLMWAESCVERLLKTRKAEKKKWKERREEGELTSDRMKR